MAVERMKFLSVVGKEKDMNEFIVKYLLNSGLEAENAIKIFEKGWKLSYYTYDNVSRELIKKCKEIMEKLQYNIEFETNEIELLNSIGEISEKLNYIEKEIKEKENKIIDNENQKKEMLEKIEKIRHLRNLDIDLNEIYDLRYIKFRYGKISKENYEKVKEQISNLDAEIIELEEDNNYFWIIYLTTENYSSKVDSYFNIMKFERVWVPGELKGKPNSILNYMEQYSKNSNDETKELEEELSKIKIKYANELKSIYGQLKMYIKIDDVKKYMAHDEKGSFYIAGWIPKSKLEEILPRLKKEEIECSIKSHDEVANIPPTHLKNAKIFKPFELIVEMYGLPNYTEIDPTKFVAITAFLMFGFMFGDVGHGLAILIAGILMNRMKIKIGAVLGFAGVSSIIFGFLYGSIFGKEGVIPKLLISPMENIQTMLISGIAFGVILIIIAMLLNIANGIKNHDKLRILFDSNGIAGIVFYSVVIFTIVEIFLKGKTTIPIGIIIGIIVVALLLILFKEKLMKIIEKKKEENKVPVVEKIFEMIEMLLSFVSNTISFVRLAAFAINHVGLCMAIYILSNMVGGAGNIVVAIIGNIIVVVLEGLIVGIQVLRLEYYELFSRFYSGDGKEYTPIGMKQTNE